MISYPVRTGYATSWATFIGDSQRVLSISNDYIIVWDIATGEPIQVEEWGAFPTWDMAFTPDSNLIAVTNKGVVEVDIERQSIVPRIDHPNEYGTFADDASAVALEAGGTISVIDLGAGQELITSIISNVAMHGMGIAPKGEFLATFIHGSSATRGSLVSPSHLTMWDTTTGSKIFDIERIGVPIKDVAFSPSGDLLAVAEDTDYTASLWNVNGQLVTTIGGFSFWVEKVEFSPDGSVLAIGDYGGNVYIYNLRSATMQKILEGPEPAGGSMGSLCTNSVGDLTFSNDGSLLAATIIDGHIKVLDWRKRQLLTSLEDSAGDSGLCASSVAFSPDGKILASSRQGGVITLWGILSE